MDETFNLPETHIEKMDRLALEHKHQMELHKMQEVEETRREKIRRSSNRQDTYQIVGVAGAIATVIIVIVIAVWNPWSDSPKISDKEVEHQREVACVENGGGWVPKDLLDVSDSGICVFPGKTATN